MTATYEARRRARLLDGIRALAIDAAGQAESDQLTCPLTTPRPRRAFADEAEPAYVEACNAIGWAPWTGRRPGDDAYPLRTLDPLPDGADAPPTLAIDMSALLATGGIPVARPAEVAATREEVQA